MIVNRIEKEDFVYSINHCVNDIDSHQTLDYLNRDRSLIDLISCLNFPLRLVARCKTLGAVRE